MIDVDGGGCGGSRALSHDSLAVGSHHLIRIMKDFGESRTVQQSSENQENARVKLQEYFSLGASLVQHHHLITIRGFVHSSSLLIIRSSFPMKDAL